MSGVPESVGSGDLQTGAGGAPDAASEVVHTGVLLTAAVGGGQGGGGGAELVPWHDPGSAGDVVVSGVVADGGVDRFVGGALDLDRTQVFSTIPLLEYMAARVRQRRRFLAEIGGEAVEISLEAARRNPDSLLDMVRHAPLSDFHERVLRADTAGFEARLEQYRQEGPTGLWYSLELTPQEKTAAALYMAKAPRKVKRDSREGIAELKTEAEEGNPWDSASQLQTNRLGKNPLYSKVKKYILDLDTKFAEGQPDAGVGMAPVQGSPKTRERLERLVMAGRYQELVRRGSRGRLAHGADLEKLRGIEYVLDQMWANHPVGLLINDPQGYSAGGEQTAPLSDELLDLEALGVALVAKYKLRGSRLRGRKAVVSQLAATINGVEEVRGDLEAMGDGQDDQNILFLDAGGVAEQEFQRAIQIAGASWRVVAQLDPPGLTAFEQELEAGLKAELAGRGMLDEPSEQNGLAPGRRGALPAALRATMGPEDFLGMAAGAAGGMAAGGAVGAADDVLLRQHGHAFGGYAARTTDMGGRYPELLERELEDRGAEYRAEDFPAEGRLLCYYGTTRTQDGQMGPIEAMAVISGAYEYIDSAGSYHNPMTEDEVRTELEAIAEKSGFNIYVSEPFGTIPPDYKCETAHFVGKMPQRFEAEHVLSVVIPNGLATLEKLPNKQLAKDIQASGAPARYKEIPAELVRFLRTDQGLEPHPGHNIEGWHWPEHILAVFFDKEDGTPSDLFQALYPQEAAEIIAVSA